MTAYHSRSRMTAESRVRLGVTQTRFSRVAGTSGLAARSAASGDVLADGAGLRAIVEVAGSLDDVPNWRSMVLPRGPVTRNRAADGRPISAAREAALEMCVVPSFGIPGQANRNR